MAAKCQHLISFLTKVIILSLLARMISSPVTYQINKQKIRGYKRILVLWPFERSLLFFNEHFNQRRKRVQIPKFPMAFFPLMTVLELSWRIFWVLLVSVLIFSESFSVTGATVDCLPAARRICKAVFLVSLIDVNIMCELSLWIPLGWLKIEL